MEVFPRENEIEGACLIALLRRLKAEDKILQRILLDKGGGDNESVAVKFASVFYVRAETILDVAQTWLHRSGERLDDKAVQIFVVVRDDSCCAAALSSNIFDKLGVAARAEAEGEHSGVVSVLSCTV